MPIEKESPLLEKIEDQIEKPDYSEKEETYLKGLRKRMETARNDRDAQHEEFDGMDYTTYYNLNERLANTFVEPKRNKEDSNFQSGTIRTKLFALLASTVNLDLSGDISAIDKNGLKIQALGDAVEDVILKTNELDGDDEKKMMRQYEILKQGTVFVEEIWDERSIKEKKLDGKFTGKLDIKWNTKIKKAFARPSRNIIPGINVYLGDITKYNVTDQPYLFTVDSMPYSEAELIFGEWERWESVPKTVQPFNELNNTGTWRLLDIQQEYVEIIRYQDKWNNEFAVLVNGVLMTPVGLPLPWGYGDYNIAQQNLEPINSKFAYGKSLVFRIRNKVAILDEMMRLAVLKTQKSFMPPRYNISGRIVSNRVFMPGKISHGIPPNSLPPIEGENTGITNSEQAMLNQLQQSIDGETTSPVFQGQQAKGGTTATEIVELQRQSKQMLGLTIFAISMLEWKLEWLRLQNILKNWFNPQDSVVNEMRGEIQAKYRETTVNRPVEGQGMGMRMVIPTENVPSSDAIMKAEDIYTKEQGVPVRFIFLNPEEIKSSKLCWQIVITPREKKTSETNKLMFRAFMQDVMPLQPNMQYIQERIASVWGENHQKLFAPNPPPEMPPEEEGAEGQGGQALSPRVNLPSAEKAMGQQVKRDLTAA